MAEEDNRRPEIKITKPAQGTTNIYANIAHISWVGSDLTVHLYQLIQPNRDIPSEVEAPNELLHSASVTLTFTSAKIFNKQLAEVIERYEQAYGIINTEFKPI